MFISAFPGMMLGCENHHAKAQSRKGQKKSDRKIEDKKIVQSEREVERQLAIFLCMIFLSEGVRPFLALRLCAFA